MEEEGRRRRRLSYTGAVLTEEAATLEIGGDYECKCGSDGLLCSHYVTGKPELCRYPWSGAEGHRFLQDRDNSCGAGCGRGGLRVLSGDPPQGKSDGRGETEVEGQTLQ